MRQDGTGGIDLGGYATNSTPFLTASYIYFQGTDDKPRRGQKEALVDRLARHPDHQLSRGASFDLYQ